MEIPLEAAILTADAGLADESPMKVAESRPGQRLLTERCQDQGGRIPSSRGKKPRAIWRAPMNLKAHALHELDATLRFFEKTVSNLTEEDSTFAPSPEMMTTAQHVAHTGMTADWFLAGGFDGEWDMDFEGEAKKVAAHTSLAAALELLRAAFARLRERTEASNDEELGATMPDNPILGAQPLYNIFEALIDHTAHHRGTLAVYTRLRGRVPPMPYMD
jgi:uncharacterized damage-inducible protein DinB